MEEDIKQERRMGGEQEGRRTTTKGDIKQERRMGGGAGGVGPQLSMEEDIKQERRMGGGSRKGA